MPVLRLAVIIHVLVAILVTGGPHWIELSSNRMSDFMFTEAQVANCNQNNIYQNLMRNIVFPFD